MVKKLPEIQKPKTKEEEERMKLTKITVYISQDTKEYLKSRRISISQCRKAIEKREKYFRKLVLQYNQVIEKK